MPGLVGLVPFTEGREKKEEQIKGGGQNEFEQEKQLE